MIWRGGLAKLDDVFAEIGLDRHHGIGFEEIVEGDLLGNHRFALGDALGADAAAEAEYGLARLGGRAAPMHLAAIRAHLRLEALEVKVEMLQRVILDAPPLLAQRFEFRQALDGGAALRREARPGEAERLLQGLVGKRPIDIALKGAARRFYHLTPLTAPPRVRRSAPPRSDSPAPRRHGGRAPRRRAASACPPC